MPVPTSYSEAVLADFMVSQLGDDIAATLGWDVGAPQVQDAIVDALLDLGVASIAAVTTPRQIRGLRALGRRAIWRAVVQATSGIYDFGDSDAKFSRSQIHEQALESLKLAENESREFDPTYSVSIVSVKRTQDPYIVLPDAERIP